ncbi:MAG: hypothetical protein IVW54_06355 [Candidatus Binataceae bacterium]|nr:hypothetical protein [Candidatus Binataceae bacterium]
MAEFTPAAVARLARDLFDYEMSADSAASVAKVATTMLADAKVLSALDLDGLEPAFSYPAILAQARLRPGK